METRLTDSASPFTRDQVEAVLAGVRPGIERHGGRIELVCIDGCDVRVALGGACTGCPSATLTLRHAVERRLREELAGFGELLADEPESKASERSWWRRLF
jgi:Fe-S cluster biogenesis protein NfuA